MSSYARGLRLGVAFSVCALVAACATPEALSDRAIAYNESIAEAADTQLLLNIVRAAYRNPVHYTAVSQMREIQQRQLGLNLLGQFPFDATDDFQINSTLSGSY